MELELDDRLADRRRRPADRLPAAPAGRSRPGLGGGPRGGSARRCDKIHTVAGDERTDGGFKPPRYHRILVAIDDSPAARLAFRHAVGIAREQHALVTLLTVVPTPSSRVAGAGIAPSELLAEMQDEADARLRALAAGAPGKVSLTTVLRQGDPAGRSWPS